MCIFTAAAKMILRGYLREFRFGEVLPQASAAATVSDYDKADTTALPATIGETMAVTFAPRSRSSIRFICLRMPAERSDMSR